MRYLIALYTKLAPVAYVDPSSFNPEWWYKDRSLVKDKSAFAPFSIGKFRRIALQL